MSKTDKYISEIKLDFYEVVSGWINFRIIVGNFVYEESFSCVFDPIIDLKNWLEALCTNVQQTSFTFFNEIKNIKFDILRFNNDWDYFNISETCEEEIFVETTVDRKQLVKAFYEGIINLSKSEKYNSKEWEFFYYREILSKNLNIKEDQLLSYLKRLKRKELIKVFYDANPICEVQSFDEKEMEKSKKPMKMTISKDYDNWDEKSKEKFIVDVLNTKVCGFDGVKLSEFKSEIIEKYLYG